MDLQTISKMIEELQLDELIRLESIPSLDLYMDQVITLFEGKLSHTKRNESDKLLTKTMINNYTKDKFLMPAYKKKYTKEHIILMIMLYELKQILTIGDIKALFNNIVNNEKVDKEKLTSIYQIYLNVREKGTESFKEQIRVVEEELREELLKDYARNIEDEMTKDILLAILLTQKANYYKRLAEKVIDECIVKSN